jgi:dynein intermediate chain
MEIETDHAVQIMEEKKFSPEIDVIVPHVATVSEPNRALDISDEEKRSIMITEEFMDFFEKSTKIMERALNEDYDILVDYNALSGQGYSELNRDSSSDFGMRLFRSFSHERWTKNRNVTDVQWSKRFPELLLGSYNKNSSNINESDGLVLIWNVHMVDRPEFVLHSQVFVIDKSDVLTAIYSPFNNSIIVGGTYSGQICIWDTRAKTTPVLSTSLSSPGHSHPISSLSIVGTQNAHNLISTSTDGTVCSWQLDMLAQSQDILELTLHSDQRTNEVSVTCMDFQQQETTSFWVGTEEGKVFQCNRFDRAGSKAGIDLSISYHGHEGPITGLQFHPGNSLVEYQSLFLTSSLDWSVRLWKAEVFSIEIELEVGSQNDCKAN